VGDTQMRFSDKQLQQFHTEFKEHVKTYEARQRAGEESVRALITAQRNNTEAIAALISDTREIVQLHRDLQAATRVGASVQKFGFWLLKWGALGSAAAATYHFGIDVIVEVFR